MFGRINIKRISRYAVTGLASVLMLGAAAIPVWSTELSGGFRVVGASNNIMRAEQDSARTVIEESGKNTGETTTDLESETSGIKDSASDSAAARETVAKETADTGENQIAPGISGALSTSNTADTAVTENPQILDIDDQIPQSAENSTEKTTSEETAIEETMAEETIGLSSANAARSTISTNYIDENGTQQSVTATVLENNQTDWSSGWYVVTGEVSIGSRVSVSGTVNLILADGCTLTASQGIQVSSGNSLTIYG